MKMLKGKIGLIGAGVRSPGSFEDEGFMRHSIVEIGEHTLKKLVISDYLENFVQPGAQATFGVSGGSFFGKQLMLLEINGKKYKHGYSHLIARYRAAGFLWGALGGIALLVLYSNYPSSVWLFAAIGLLAYSVYRFATETFAYTRFC